jgi:hypothetical protein
MGPTPTGSMTGAAAQVQRLLKADRQIVPLLTPRGRKLTG